MAAIHEELILADKFSATFSRYLTLGSQAAGATERANTAVKNYQAVLSSLDRRLITLNSQFSAMAGEQQGLLAAGRQNSAEFAALDARMEQLGGAIRTLQAQYSAVEREAEEAAAANRSLAGSFDTVRQASAGAVRAPAADAAESAIGQTAPYLARSGGAASVYARALADVQAQLARANVDLTVQRQLLTQTSAGQTAAAGTAADLERELSGTVSRVQRLTAEERALRTALESAAGGAKQADRALEQYQQSAATARAATSGLTGSLRGLLGGLLGLQTVKGLAGMSDSITATTARLDRMNDGLQTTEELQNMIWQSAQRSRGVYADTAAFAAKLGTLAGDAFGSNAEIVAFAEQINKQIALSGASATEASAALLQLTQGLASGTLRGEELNSVLEQTPMIAQTIANYMGVTTGQMRELASQGAVTAEVVKNAMFAAAAETDEAFEQMPMTWAQVWNSFQNIAVRALNPVLNAISWVANNIETVGPIVLSLGAAFAVFLLAANWTNICTAATAGLANAQKMLGAVMATTWGLPLIIIALVIGAIYAVTAAVNHFAGTSVSATGIIAGAVLTVAALIGNTVIGLLNGIIQAVWSIFVNPFLGIIEWVLNVANGGFNSFGDAVANLIGNIISWFLDLGKVVTKIIDAIFGTNWTAGLNSLQNSVLQWGKNENAITLDRTAPTIDHRFTYSGAWNTGYNWGANLFSGSSAGGYDLSAAYTPYNEISNQLGNISGSVGGIEKTVRMTDEDIKSLVDVAERRYVNNVNLTAQTPVITVNGQNTGHTAADRQNLANAIRDILIEQRASGSTRSTARPTVG